MIYLTHAFPRLLGSLSTSKSLPPVTCGVQHHHLAPQPLAQSYHHLAPQSFIGNLLFAGFLLCHPNRPLRSPQVFAASHQLLSGDCEVFYCYNFYFWYNSSETENAKTFQIADFQPPKLSGWHSLDYDEIRQITACRSIIAPLWNFPECPKTFQRFRNIP